MVRKVHSSEDIVRKLRQADVLLHAVMRLMNINK
jgi:hypothetical protein